jgi:hypothetical protein
VRPLRPSDRLLQLLHYGEFFVVGSSTLKLDEMSVI